MNNPKKNIAWKKLGYEYLELVRNWRMQPDITQYMYTDPVITPEDQAKWYERISQDATQRWWVCVVDGEPVGCYNLIQIDYKNKRCVSGGYIAVHEARSFDVVIANEYALMKAAFDILGLERIQAEVMGNNPREVKMLMMNGYTKEGVLRQYVHKNGETYDVTILSMLKSEWDAGKVRYKYDRIEIEV